MEARIRKSSLIDFISTILSLGIVYMEIFKNASEALSGWMTPFIGVCGLVLSLICFLCYRSRIYTYTYLLIFFSFVMAIINHFFIGQIVIGRIISMFIVYLPVALILSFRLESKILSVVVKLFFVICGFHLLITFFLEGNNILLFYKTSRNYISVYMTVVLFIVSVYSYNINRKVNTGIIVFYFICCILAIGRGGIIAASVYLILQVYCRIFKDKSGNNVSFKKIILFFCVVFMVIIVALNFESIAAKYFGNFLISHNSSDNSRIELLSSYMRRMFSSEHLEEFFVGVKTINIGRLGIKYNGNLHNSVFMFHSYFGIAGIIMLIISIAHSIYYYWKEKKWDMVCMIVCIFTRSLTDYFYPGGLGDIFIWYIMILYLNQKSQLKMKKRAYVKC